MPWQLISSRALAKRQHGREVIWLPPKSTKLADLKYNSGWVDKYPLHLLDWPETFPTSPCVVTAKLKRTLPGLPVQTDGQRNEWGKADFGKGFQRVQVGIWAFAGSGKPFAKFLLV